jgi:hypothetical protein
MRWEADEDAHRPLTVVLNFDKKDRTSLQHVVGIMNDS